MVDIDHLLNATKDAVLRALQCLEDAANQSELKNHQFSEEIPREMKAAADTVVEELIIDSLSKFNIPILSEECGEISNDASSDLRFIIDPVDGTVNFVREIAPCGVSIALFQKDKPVFGVIGVFPTMEIAWGGRGIGAFINDNPIHVSKIERIAQGVLSTGFPARFQFDDASATKAFYKQLSLFGKVRMLGAASQSLLQVARGSVDVYMEKEIMLWDIAAGIALVEGAGGEITLQAGKNNNAFNVIADNGLVKIAYE